MYARLAWLCVYNDVFAPLCALTASTPCLSDRHTQLPSGSMKITETRVTDSGTYLCVATNIAGNFSQAIRLRVYGKTRNGVIYQMVTSYTSIDIASLHVIRILMMVPLNFMHNNIVSKISHIYQNHIAVLAPKINKLYLI